MFTIKTPNAGFTGIRNGIAIIDGVGRTESPEVAADLSALGYSVDPHPSTAKAEKNEPPKEDEPTFGKAKHPLSYFDGMTDEQARAVDGVGTKTLDDIKTARAERDGK